MTPYRTQGDLRLALHVGLCLAAMHWVAAPAGAARYEPWGRRQISSRIEGLAPATSPTLTTDAALTFEPQRTAIFSAAEFAQSATPCFGWEAANVQPNPFVELRATAEKLSVRDIAALLGVSHTAVYGWIKGERAPEDREKAAIRLNETLAEIIRLVPDKSLPQILRAETAIGLSAQELIQAGEYDAAVASVLMISPSAAASAPFGEGMELLTAVPVPRWADSVTQPDVESVVVLEDNVAFIPSENEISIVAAVTVG